MPLIRVILFLIVFNAGIFVFCGGYTKLFWACSNHICIFLVQ